MVWTLIIVATFRYIMAEKDTGKCSYLTGQYKAAVVKMLAGNIPYWKNESSGIDLYDISTTSFIITGLQNLNLGLTVYCLSYFLQTSERVHVRGVASRLVTSFKRQSYFEGFLCL